MIQRLQTTRRVVVTGLGVISPIGNDTRTFWNNMLKGQCGIGPITRFDCADFRSKVAGEVKEFEPSDYLDHAEIQRSDLYTQFALAAAKQAVDESGIEGSVDSERYGVLFGSAIGGIGTFMREHLKLIEKGPKRVSPFFIPMMISNMASGMIAIRYGCRGPVMPAVTACASGSTAIGEAVRTIRHGYADAFIAGGAEAAITASSAAGFLSLKALSCAEDPMAACLPFDARRKGFVMGEGAAALVLEEYEHARARNANIVGEIVGYGSTCDAFHITAPEPQAEETGRAMQLAMKEAEWSGDDVVYVNAHGTGTPMNDSMETRAIKNALGPENAAKAVVSSTKSMTGHMLGAAGAAEAIACLFALRDQIVPPTIHLEEPDPECDLDYVPNEARKVPVTLALSNSFGFGGHNASLAFRRVGEQ